ncbi:hypothetical protein DSUL_50071 [Desulfovibrionales bacterium]
MSSKITLHDLDQSVTKFIFSRHIQKMFFISVCLKKWFMHENADIVSNRLEYVIWYR